VSVQREEIFHRIKREGAEHADHPGHEGQDDHLDGSELDHAEMHVSEAN
jgi:hypothetical protein